MSRYPKFSSLLKKYMTEREYPVYHLAQQLDVNKSTVSRWRNKADRPGTPELVHHIADLLSLSHSERQNLLHAAGYKDGKGNQPPIRQFDLSNWFTTIGQGQPHTTSANSSRRRSKSQQQPPHSSHSPVSPTNKASHTYITNIDNRGGFSSGRDAHVKGDVITGGIKKVIHSPITFVRNLIPRGNQKTPISHELEASHYAFVRMFLYIMIIACFVGLCIIVILLNFNPF